jgi:hypothetical protein
VKKLFLSPVCIIAVGGKNGPDGSREPADKCNLKNQTKHPLKHSANSEKREPREKKSQ